MPRPHVPRSTVADHEAQDFAHDHVIHVRIVIGTGLTVTRLLTGLARYVQHPVRDRIYLAQLAWTFFLLLAIVHFWWFEFGLQCIGIGAFEVYRLVICYAALFFFLGALLFPDRMEIYWIASQFEVLS
jgi:hypothetical protein